MQDDADAMVGVRQVPSAHRSLVEHSALLAHAAPVDLRGWHSRVLVSQ
jgi:hypothetical protein